MCHLSGKRIFLKPRTRQWIGAPSLVRSTRRPCGARAACAVALTGISFSSDPCWPSSRPLSWALALRSALYLTDSSHSRSHLNVSSTSLLDGRMRMRMRSMLGSPRHIKLSLELLHIKFAPTATTIYSYYCVSTEILRITSAYVCQPGS